MVALLNSIIGIHIAQKELGKYPEAVQRKIMEKIQSKAITSSCLNLLYLIGALTSAGLIQWVLQQ